MKSPVSRNGVAGNLRRMERPYSSTSTSPRSIGELLINFDKFNASDDRRRLYPWTQRFVMGLPLPRWQRALVWSTAQKVRFIESLWSGVDVGSYLVNDLIDFVEDASGRCYALEFSDVVLDGQQRLNALESYVTSQFAVDDAQGIPVYWHELSIVEQRFFASKTFARSQVRLTEEADLRRMYDLRAFGGTPHEESERASPRAC